MYTNLATILTQSLVWNALLQDQLQEWILMMAFSSVVLGYVRFVSLLGFPLLQKVVLLNYFPHMPHFLNIKPLC